MRELQAAGAFFGYRRQHDGGHVMAMGVRPGGDLDRCNRLMEAAMARSDYPLTRVEIFADILRRQLGLENAGAK